jgi:hypothetical protein
MGVTSASTNDDAGREPQLSSGPAPIAAGATATEAPARQLVSSIGGDRCVTCDTPLASDQRYCLSCGERRGKSRFTAATTAVHAAAAPPVAAVPQTASGDREPPRRRVASGTTLVTGIATLLLAMGVGVEIGRISNNGNAGTRASAGTPAVQVVTVGGGGASTTAGAAASTGSTAKSTAKSTPVPASSTKVTPVSKKVQTKATQAASQVLGSSAKNLAPATVQQGGKCTSGQAGCQGGKFTGNFFGQ